MADAARVGSIEALREFRDAMSLFAAEGEQIIAQANADVSRSVREIGETKLGYWKAESQRLEREVVKRKIDMEQARWAKAEGDSLVDERKALARTREALDHARRKLDACKRWRLQLQREEMMFRGQLEPLRRYLEGQAPRAMRQLDDMAKRLEEYVLLSAPTVDREQRGDGDRREPGDGGSEDADHRSMKRGSRDAAFPERESDAGRVTMGDGESEIALLRRLVPSGEAVAAAPTADVKGMPRHVLTMSQRRELAKIAAHAGSKPLDLRTTVAVSGLPGESGLLVHHRVEPVGDGDSGWRTFVHPGLDFPDADRADPPPVAAMSAAALARSQPTMTDIWRLPVGWTVVTGPRGLATVYDASGERLWPTLHGSSQGRPTR